MLPTLVVKLAVFVHEESIESLSALLASSGFSDPSNRIVLVFRRFSEVWKTSSRAEREDYVRKHKEYVPRLLLFELVHENHPTPSMQEAAASAGIASVFQEWVTQLAVQSNKIAGTRNGAHC